MKKKLALLILGSLLATGLVACNKQEASVETNTTVEAETTEATTEETTETAEETEVVEEVTAESIIASLEKFDNVMTEAVTTSKVHGTFVENPTPEDVELLIDFKTLYSRSYADGIYKEDSETLFDAALEGTEDELAVETVTYLSDEDKLQYMLLDDFDENFNPIGKKWFIRDASAKAHFDLAKYSEEFKDAHLEEKDGKYIISDTFKFDSEFLLEAFGLDVALDIHDGETEFEFNVTLTIDKETNRIETILANHKSESELEKIDTTTTIMFSGYGDVEAIEIPEEALAGELQTTEYYESLEETSEAEETTEGAEDAEEATEETTETEEATEEATEEVTE